MHNLQMKGLRMNLYLISQDVNNDYDTYDSAVVVANSLDEARVIHPDTKAKLIGDEWHTDRGCDYMLDETWVSHKDLSKVTVKLLGKADRRLKLGDVVCASFNAG